VLLFLSWAARCYVNYYHAHNYDMIRKLDTSLCLSSLRGSNLKHSQDLENVIKKSFKTLATPFLYLRSCSLTVGTTLHSLTLRVEAEVLSETLIPTKIRDDTFRKAWIFILDIVSQRKFWRLSYITAFILSINHRYLFRKCTDLLFRICLQLSLPTNFAPIDVHRIVLETKAAAHWLSP